MYQIVVVFAAARGLCSAQFTVNSSGDEDTGLDANSHTCSYLATSTIRCFVECGTKSHKHRNKMRVEGTFPYRSHSRMVKAAAIFCLDELTCGKSQTHWDELLQ